MVKLAADLHKDVTQTVESPPRLNCEGLPDGGLEADTPVGIVRADLGEERVAGVQ